MHCILGHNIHGECFKLIPCPADAFLSLLKAPLLGPSDLKLHNMDDIFCSFACLHLFVLLSLSDFHHLNPFTLFSARPKTDLFLHALSCEISYTMGNTPNSFIILNFGVEADFHPAIIDDISLSGKSQAIPSTLVSPLLSEMQVGIFSHKEMFSQNPSYSSLTSFYNLKLAQRSKSHAYASRYFSL